jgi:hypothetical protein
VLGVTLLAIFVFFASHPSSPYIPYAPCPPRRGKGGAFLLVLQLFMAVTAAGSAEQIAVSSLASYDIYKEYINPKATGKQMVLVSRVMVVVYAILSGENAVHTMVACSCCTRGCVPFPR